MNDTLRKIDAELRGTLEWITELEETPGTDDALLSEAHAGLREYKGQLARKVDGFAALLLQLRDEREAAETERARINQRIHRCEVIETRLKSIAVEVLAAQPEPKRGSRQLTGSLHTLSLRGNGGLEPLDIPAPAMVPDEFAMFTLRVDGATWRYILQTISLRGNDDLVRVMEIEANRECSNTLIREELARACKACGGIGGFTPDGAIGVTCEACGGTGTRGVPGARLMPRGFHVRIS